MVLACHNIYKSFGTDVILSDCSFHIEDYEKAAIVGINGAGKSTLLKIIMDELPPDSGQVIITKDKTIGYLSQHQSVKSNNTIFNEILSVKQDIIDMETQLRSLELQMKYASGEALEALMNTYSTLNHKFESANGYAYRSEVIGILKGLGFLEHEFNKAVHTLSGGQKTRIALGKLLVSKPNLILLDEPTNHLDMESIAWLETYLLNYSGAVIVVAHDRYFLDKITSKIIEIEHSKSISFSGNYSDYALKKEMLRTAEMNAYLNQQQEIKHHEEVITKLRSFNREKSIRRAESREKMLDKIQVLDKPIVDTAQMNITLDPHILSGNDVLTVEGLAKSFPPLTLFTDLSFQIKRGEHTAIIGNNGTGKTTILKILNALVEPDAGTFYLGAKVKIGYYDQEHHVLHMDKTLFEEISDEYPKLSNTEIRNTLAAFLFTRDDVYKCIKDLSGGERGRVSLAKLMLSEANFLILDEPTNHLDMVSKEILEQALNRYTGTVLYVSHDRYFINKTASRIMDLTDNQLLNYIGDYDYYLEKKPDAADSSDTESFIDTASASKQDWQSKKEEQAKERKRQNELKKVEDEIAGLEARDSELDALMLRENIATNVAECIKISQEKEEIAEKLESLLSHWEQLSI